MTSNATSTYEKAEYYLSLPSIRAQCAKVFNLVREGKLEWWEYDSGKEGVVLDFCENLLEVSTIRSLIFYLSGIGC